MIERWLEAWRRYNHPFRVNPDGGYTGWLTRPLNGDDCMCEYCKVTRAAKRQSLWTWTVLEVIWGMRWALTGFLLGYLLAEIFIR